MNILNELVGKMKGSGNRPTPLEYFFFFFFLFFLAKYKLMTTRGLGSPQQSNREDCSFIVLAGSDRLPATLLF